MCSGATNHAITSTSTIMHNWFLSFFLLLVCSCKTLQTVGHDDATSLETDCVRTQFVYVKDTIKVKERITYIYDTLNRITETTRTYYNIAAKASSCSDTLKQKVRLQDAQEDAEKRHHVSKGLILSITVAVLLSIVILYCKKKMKN